ncbi:MAG: hypothetical protein Kow0054_12220 [Deferrisoma sp.]
MRLRAAPAEGPSGAVRLEGGKVETGRTGPGWRSALADDTAGAEEAVVVDLAGQSALLDPASGSLTLVLEYTGPRPEGSAWDGLVQFLDAQGRSLVALSVAWNRTADGRPTLYFVGEERVWGELFPCPLPRPGEELRVTLTWDGDPTRNRVLVNGRVLKGYRYGGDPISEPDRARVAFVRVAERAARIVLGAEVGTDGDGTPWTWSPMTRFLLREFTLTGAGPGLAVAGVAAERTLVGAGQEIAVTLTGSPDAEASFTIAGVTANVAMTEVDDGVYVGKVAVPEGVNGTFGLTGALTDPSTGEKASLSGPSITIDTTAPEPVPAGRILASSPWPGEIEVTWQASPSADVDHYEIFRGEGGDPDLAGAPYETTRELSFTDTAVVPGLAYRYAVVAVDRAGNRSAPSEVVAAEAAPGEGPAITAVTVEPFGKPAKPGETVTVTVVAQSGAAVTADIGTLVQALPLTEEGRTGRYTGTYTVADADVGPTKALHRVVVHVADAYGSADRAGPELAVVGLDALNDTTPPVIASAEHDFFSAVGFSGKLVAGDVLTVTLTGEPGGYATFDLPGVAEGIAMAEVEPGTYRGTYTVGWDDEGAEVPVIVHLADDAGNVTTQPVGRPVSFDTRVRLFVTARDALLPADQKATTRLTVKAENANGDPVSGHELALTLSTTEEYTGVVGGGRLEDKEARMDDVDDVEVKWGGVTDAFGEVTATYTAGFAAKTALVVAKDLTTGDVGAGWLNTYVASTVAIELYPRAQKGMEDRAVLTMTAEPAWLTADGRSTSRVKAKLLDLQGNPIEGARVSFALGNENGRLRVLRGGRTDERGIAEAEYRAGTVAGFVTITAASEEWGVTQALQIELRADAPAKIELVAGADRLPTGGETALSVRVTDIHDNPNVDVPVTFAVLEGSGTVNPEAIQTDRNGEGQTTFRAGSRPGTVIVEARHTSRAPTEEELRRIYGTVFVPRLAERQERDRVKVAEWLVEPGDEVVKGQPLVVLEGRRTTWTLGAPAAGTFVRRVKHRRDRVELGDTLGYIEIDPDAWADEYAGTLGR